MLTYQLPMFSHSNFKVKNMPFFMQTNICYCFNKIYKNRQKLKKAPGHIEVIFLKLQHKIQHMDA